MAHDDNPLDRISSGPPPSGDQPWRSSRAPIGGLYSTGETRKRKRMGRIGWIALIVAVLLIAGVICWAALAKPDGSITVSTRYQADSTYTFATPPAPPSVEQIDSNRLYTTELYTPARCALPPWSTDPAQMQTFINAGTSCFEAIWDLKPVRAELLSTSDDTVPGSGCPASARIPSFLTCGDVTYFHTGRMIAGTGNQAGRLCTG